MRFLKAPPTLINSYSNLPVVLHIHVDSDDEMLDCVVKFKAIKGKAQFETKVIQLKSNTKHVLIVHGYETIPKEVLSMTTYVVIKDSTGKKLVSKTKVILSRSLRSLEWMGFTTYSSHTVFIPIPDFNWEPVLTLSANSPT